MALQVAVDGSPGGNRSVPRALARVYTCILERERYVSMLKTDPNHLFIIRIWEQAEAEGASPTWRGLAQHVESGQQLYFTSLRDLNDFILLKMRQAEPPDLPASEWGKEAG